MAATDLEKYDCDRCGFTYKKTSLRKQRGLLVCPGCYDDPAELAPFAPHFGSPRLPSTTTTSGTAQVFEITSAGVSWLSNSVTHSRAGDSRMFVMRVVGSGGPVTVVADPAIVTGGLSGDVLTLVGTATARPIKFVGGTYLQLQGGAAMVLGQDDCLTISFDGTVWREASRFKNDFVADSYL